MAFSAGPDGPIRQFGLTQQSSQAGRSVPVKAGIRLIQHDESRLGYQRLPDEHPPAHASGQRPQRSPFRGIQFQGAQMSRASRPAPARDIPRSHDAYDRYSVTVQPPGSRASCGR